LVIERIPTDPTLTQRLTIPPQTPRWQTIGDEDLINDLADAGQSVGLIRTHGQTVLVSSLPSDTP
jgi:hypothetical protein